MSNDFISFPDNNTIGYVIIDSCSIPERVIHFLDRLKINQADIFAKVVAAVGFPHSDDYLPLADYFTARDIMVLSMGIQELLPNINEVLHGVAYMVPQRQTNVRAILTFLQATGIEHVGLVFSDSKHGIQMAEQFMKMSRTFNVSAIYAFHIDENILADDASLDEITSTFIHRNSNITKVVVLLTDLEETVKTIKSSKRNKTPGIMWLSFNDINDLLHTHNTKHNDLGSLVYDIISISLHLQRVSSFETFLNSKVINSSQDENIIDLVQLFNTSSNSSAIADYMEELCENTFGVDLIIDSISAVRQGINILTNAFCMSERICTAVFRNIERIPHLLFDNKLRSLAGNIVQFDSKHNGVRSFQISRCHLGGNGTYSIVSI